jgi:hypothetical protein
MTCRHFEDRIILSIFNELSDTEEIQLNNHLSTCETCRQFLNENKLMLSDISRDSEPQQDWDWEGYWSGIKNVIRKPERKIRFFFPLPAKALSFAMSAAILIAGIFIGKVFMSSPAIPLNGHSFDSRNGNMILVGNYFEDVKPVMMDYANYTFNAMNGNGGPVDKGIIRKMLDNTRMLRKHISGTQDPYLSALLEDLEMILTEIKNASPGENESMTSLQGMIREKNIPLKIDLFKNKVKRFEKI